MQSEDLPSSSVSSGFLNRFIYRDFAEEISKLRRWAVFPYQNQEREFEELRAFRTGDPKHLPNPTEIDLRRVWKYVAALEGFVSACYEEGLLDPVRLNMWESERKRAPQPSWGKLEVRPIEYRDESVEPT
jgi:hypothetical protein